MPITANIARQRLTHSWKLNKLERPVEEDNMVTPGYQLIMRQGPTPGLVYDLVKPELTIGRDMTNDFVINDAEVSRKHVVLRLEGGNYVIEDLGSTNGSFINGQRLMGPHLLKAGELVTLGENVGLLFEAIRPDLAATVVGGEEREYPPQPVRMTQPQPAPQPVYRVPPAPPAPAYVPPEPYIEEELLPEEAVETSSRSLWMIAGCGCLALVAITCAAAVLAIDYYNLWCTLFGSVIPGCP
jgi:pSer/pThr/pTyr-binding forkhead associated (FHA) protein